MRKVGDLIFSLISSDKKVAALLWLITFLLYIPAAKAGWVIDAAGWLCHVRDHSETFWPYLNRSWSTIPGLYQLTQLVTLGFYKLWGTNVWAWSLLYLCLHAGNAFLLFKIFTRILSDSGYEHRVASLTVFTGVLLYTVSPQISEVLIWKACFHYLFGSLLQLTIITCFIRFQHTGKIKFVLLAALLFGCSVFSLEVFYATPFYLLILIIYYKHILKFDGSSMTRNVRLFLVPQVLFFIVYLQLFHYVYPVGKPHVYNLLSQSPDAYLSKIPEYIYHILFLGRYFPWSIRQEIYDLCHTTWFLCCFYLFATLAFIMLLKVAMTSPFTKVLFLLIFFISISLTIVAPLSFPEYPLLVFYDRYGYQPASFLFMATVLIIYKAKRVFLRNFILLFLLLANINFSIHLLTLWKHSAYITHRLLHDVPVSSTGKKILLLNVPENMEGAPMIGASPNGAFMQLYHVFGDGKITDSIYDVLSYNLTSIHDAVQVHVRNDSEVLVSFNQVGNWWWYDGAGAGSYSNRYYRVNISPLFGHYRLTLKEPHSHYILLYELDGNWYPVKWEIERQDWFEGKDLDTYKYDEWLLERNEAGSIH